MTERRSYAGELEWAIDQIGARNHDRNRNRMAQVSAAVQYGQLVGLARRSKRPLPERPNLDKAI